MSSKKRELRETLRPAVKLLVLREIRFMQMEESLAPSFVLDELSRSIQEAKREIVSVVRLMPEEERDPLLRGILRRSVDEEIDRAVALRRNRCLRCVYIRYVDRAGERYEVFPVRERRAVSIGCAVDRQTPGIHCKHFAERLNAIAMEDFLGEVSFLYQLREMFDEMTEFWKEYLTR